MQTHTHTHTHTLSTEHSGYMALPFTKNGVTVVAIGYDLAPKGKLIFPGHIIFGHKYLVAKTNK